MARLEFTDRIPVASTVWRLLVRFDAEMLVGWLRALVTPPTVADRRWRRVIAIDGKVLRRSRLPDGSQQTTNFMAAPGSAPRLSGWR